MDAVGEEKIKEAFVRVSNQVIKDRDIFIKRMTENIEQVYLKKASVVDAEPLTHNWENYARRCPR
ncbi:MAG: hypothetical protein P4N59_29785 [Negativicutes bacterium]|nr:hypothetical protein [Negativicutes bacterium]